MNKGLSALGAVGFGAGLLYFFDPVHGRDRRERAREGFDSAKHLLEEAKTSPALVELRDRAMDIVSEVRESLKRPAPTDDAIQQRLRSQLGRWVTYPTALDLAVQDGAVTIHGPVLASEADRLLGRLNRARGVSRVDHRLDLHEGEDIPALQGGTAPRGAAAELLESPAARLVAGALGGMIALNGLRRGRAGTSLAMIGLGLVARALGARRAGVPV